LPVRGITPLTFSGNHKSLNDSTVGNSGLFPAKRKKLLLATKLVALKNEDRWLVVTMPFPGLIVAIGSIVAGVLATIVTATAAVVDWKASKDAQKAEKAKNEAKEGGGEEAGAKPK
jgi:hypothetical protein